MSLRATTETFPWDDFAEDSRQLEDFRCADFSSMARELSRVLPNQKTLQLEPVVLAQRTAKDLARPYIRNPHRRFEGGRGAEDLADLYETLALDDLFLEASQVEALQQSLCWLPVPASDGRIRLLAFRPGEAFVEWEDALETDVRYAKRVEALIPVQTQRHVVTFGKLVITPTEAYIERPGRGRAGLFAAWGHGEKNPLGHIPGHAVRSVPAPRGAPWGPLAQDVLAMQIAVIIGLVDLELVCRFQGHGREVLIGIGAKLSAAGARQVRVGPSTMWAFDESEPNTLRHELTSPQPAIDRTIMALELAIGLLQRYRYIRGAGGDSKGITGRAKEFEQVEELEEQYRCERRWRTAEQRIAEILTDCLTLKGGRLGGYKAPRVHVNYQYVTPRENDLQSTQASILRYLTGADSPGELVARRENVSVETAWELVAERMEKNKEFLSGLSSRDVPGIDSLAGAVSNATSPARGGEPGEAA